MKASLHGGMTVKPHWTQTPEGKAKLAKAMKRVHRAKRKAARKGLAGSKKGITKRAPADLRSVVVYLQQAQDAGPRMARCLVELALLTLLGEK